MKLVKCPRCDLNYITEAEKYCKVCLREMKGGPVKEEAELCSVCNEEPVIPGKDVCIFCLNEMNGENGGDQQETAGIVDPGSIAAMESVATMDEIMPDISDEEAKEFGDMADELSLESVREDEDRDDDDDEDEDM